MESVIALKSQRVHGHKGTQITGLVTHPGEVFVEKLQELSKAEIEENRGIPVSSREGLATIKEQMSRMPKPAKIIEILGAHTHFTLLSAVELVESLARANIVIPLLDLRLRYGDELFRNPLVYLDHFSSLPGPITRVQIGERAKAVDCTSDPRWWLWSGYCFLVDLIGQIVAGRAVLACPRRESPLFATMNFARGGSCASLLASGACGFWKKNMRQALPECLFSQIVHSTQLA